MSKLDQMMEKHADERHAARCEKDESVKMKCPRCGEEQDDFDGLGVAYCEQCDYCGHLSGTGDLETGEMRCDICDKPITHPATRMFEQPYEEAKCSRCGGQVGFHHECR